MALGNEKMSPSKMTPSRKSQAGDGAGEWQQHARVRSWLEDVRRDLKSVNEGADDFDTLRSEAVFRRVMTRIEEDRRRGFWALRTLWLWRTLKIVTAAAAGLWNSRTVRLLIP